MDDERDDSLQQDYSGNGQMMPPPPPQPPPQPPPEPPFTQADGLQLQRLQAGLSQANQQLDEGAIDTGTHQELMGQLLPRIESLGQRQQKAQKMAQEQQKTQAMDALALQESVEAMHASKQAQDFPRTVASYTDPVSGQTAHFFQKKRGDWEELKFERESERAKRDRDNAGEMGSSPVGGDQQGFGSSGPNLPDNPPATGAVPASTGVRPAGLDAPGLAEGQPIPLEQLGQQLRQQAGGPGEEGPTEKLFRQAQESLPLARIYNGAGEDITEQQKAAYERFRRTGSWAPESAGAGIKGQLSQQQIQEIYRRADQAVPPTNPNNPHLMLHRQEMVQAAALKQMENHYRHENHEGQLAALQEKLKTQAEYSQKHLEQQLKNQEELHKHKLQLQKEQPMTQKELHAEMAREEQTIRAGYEKKAADVVLGKEEQERYRKLAENDQHIAERAAANVGRRHAVITGRDEVGVKPPAGRKEPPPAVDPRALVELDRRIGQVNGVQNLPGGAHQEPERMGPPRPFPGAGGDGADVPLPEGPALLKLGPAPLTAAEKEEPSSIGPRRVAQLQERVHRAIAAIPLSERMTANSLLGQGLNPTLIGMDNILSSARRRGMTRGQRIRYEALHSQLEALLKPHGGNAHYLHPAATEE